MKLLIIPSSISQIKNTLDYCDAYLIGIKGLSVNDNLKIDIDEIDELFKIIGSKDVFININKNISNSDIDYVKTVMSKLNNYKIKGIFYYDVAILNIYINNNYHYDLVWASEHASTNYNTINYWLSKGVNYCLVSSDITIKEVLSIRKNTSCGLIVPIFGYQPMFNSKRHIVKNYLEYFKLFDKSKINYIKKEDKFFPIVDNDIGTEVYTNYIMNGLKEFKNFKDNNIDYVLLNSFNIDNNKFLDCLKIIKNDIDTAYEEVSKLFDNIDDGFLYRETITKVKKDEK